MLATRTAAMLAFEQLIAPLTADVFFRDVWQQQTVLMRQPAGRDFSQTFSLEAFDHLLTGTILRGSDLMLVRDGVYPARGTYTTSDTWAGESFQYSTVVDAAKVLEQYDRGTTLILHAIHRSWPPLARLCRQIENVLSCSVSGAALLSPPNLDPSDVHQGPPIHYDVHDHLILQIAGTKRWRFYDNPFPLPLGHQPHMVTRVKAGPLTQELTLHPGDVLYFPGGQMHEAIATDEPSLHLPLSLCSYRWYDALTEALKALDADVRMRRAIPPHMLTAEGLDDFLAEFASVAKQAFEQLSGTEAARHLRQSLLESRRPLLDGALLDRARLDQIGLETVVRRRPGTLSEIRHASDRVLLCIGRKALTDPTMSHAILRFIEDAPSFAVAELPGDLSSAEKLTLVKNLIREGYLELAEPRASVVRDPRSFDG